MLKFNLKYLYIVGLGAILSFFIIYAINYSIFMYNALQPGDPCIYIMDNQHDPDALNQYYACRVQLGLDLPISDQFVLYIQRTIGLVIVELIPVWIGLSFIIFLLWKSYKRKQNIQTETNV